MVKIRTTHVGSLPRSNELSSLLSLKDNKEFVPSFTKKILKQVSTLF